MSIARAATLPGSDVSWPVVQQIQRQIESHFLDMGSLLLRTGHALDEQRVPIDELTRLKDDMIEATCRRLAQAKTGSHDLEQAMVTSMEAVKTLDTQVEILARELKCLWRSVRTMKIVGLNAKVSASELAGRHKGLSVFTTATGEIVQNSEQVLTDADTLVEKIRDRIARLATSGFGRQLEDMRQFTQNLVALAEMFEGLTNGNEAQLQLGGALLQRNADLAAALGEGLVALQVGDATRQRLEHCEQILSLPDPAGHSQIEDLACAQLRVASDTFTIEADRLSEKLVEALRISQELAGKGGGRQSKGTLFSQVGDITAAAETQLGLIRMVLLETGRQSSTLFSEFGQLSDRLRDIGALEEQMRIVGMNAIIGCGQLGDDGMALKEIARQLGQLAAENSRIYNDVKAALNGIETHIGKFITMMEQPAELVDRIETETRAIIDESGKLVRSGQQLRAGLVAAVTEVGEGLPKARRELDQLKRRLAEEARKAQPSQSLQALPDALDAKIMEIYSMEEERALHRALFGKEDAAASPPPADDIFF
ncbi:hypothetical protein [Thioclava kandeliae]|uniref:Methyl-accepting transducer domain-containing protein n=1 Tax=Thioclava kandeliae TaxID=3070818 RepID=A0ABV1SES4_9RHOB